METGVAGEITWHIIVQTLLSPSQGCNSDADIHDSPVVVPSSNEYLGIEAVLVTCISITY